MSGYAKLIVSLLMPLALSLSFILALVVFGFLVVMPVSVGFSVVIFLIIASIVPVITNN